MRRTSRALLMLLLTAIAPSVARAQAAAHPDYSGSWVLDPAQSDAGQFTPTKLTQKVVQTGNQIVIDRAQTNPMGETTATLKYALDGTTSVNEISMGPSAVKISTVVTWEGDSPVFSSNFAVQGTDVTSKDKWALSDGGKKLTVTRALNIGGQEGVSKLVLVKQ